METRTYKSFTDLEVWQVGRQLKNDIMELVKCFPPKEKYRLTDQIVRSSRSVTSNIAEGYGRFTYKDQIHFCMQARGSLFETINHLIDANDSGYILENILTIHKRKANEVERLLNGYISWLRKMTT